MIDHLVYGAPALPAAIAEMERRLGVRPAIGGKHAGRGTHNALLCLGRRTYLEIIAPDPEQRAPAVPLPFGLAGLAAPRLVTWAASAPDIEARVAQAREAGYDPGAVLALTRETPDGQLLSWRLTYRLQLAGEGLVPFLIDWGNTPHPSGTAPAGCTLLGLRAEHPNPESVRAMLQAIRVELPLSRGPDPALIARIRCPAGDIELW